MSNNGTSHVRRCGKENEWSQDADAKAFAAAVLPTVRSHLKAIIAIATDMGIDVK
jgi:hypothetical protein